MGAGTANADPSLDELRQAGACVTLAVYPSVSGVKSVVNTRREAGMTNSEIGLTLARAVTYLYPEHKSVVDSWAALGGS